MSEDLTQLQLREARRALTLCTGERDRAREEARQLRAQLRGLRAELQAVRPVEQVELLAAQQALAEAQEQVQAARAQQLQAEAEREQAQAQVQRAEAQVKQARIESDMSLERVIELREELTRLRANQSINAAAVAMLRAELDASRAEAPEPGTRPPPPPATAPQSTDPGSTELQAAGPLQEEGVASGAEPGEDAPGQAQSPSPELSAPVPNVAFDHPEGAIWEFEGVAEPEHFMALCIELCARAAGDYLRIGHFAGQVDERDWNLVVMAGPEHSVRDFLVALDREHMRLMSATGLPLVRIQPTRWCANVLGADYEQVAPTRYKRLQALVVSGALEQQEGGQ